MSVLHKCKQTSQRRREGFTDTEDVRDVDMVHLVCSGRLERLSAALRQRHTTDLLIETVSLWANRAAGQQLQ